MTCKIGTTASRENCTWHPCASGNGSKHRTASHSRLNGGRRPAHSSILRPSHHRQQCFLWQITAVTLFTETPRNVSVCP